jgi:hypothetical protein
MPDSAPWEDTTPPGPPLAHALAPPQTRPVTGNKLPTASAYPWCQTSPPGTKVVAPTPVARPRRMSAPRTQTRAEHVFPAYMRVRPRKQGFLHMSTVRDSGNKTTASAHGMGLGGLAVDTVEIGCLVVDRCGE